ncbi:hypothetical protein F4776DRAFT_623747 [Hypoxylon sp. NC0597]|nr:hypothetical protein F4776DRAFT_623747 [Hypoxylon sp. NC0597]
MSSPAKDLVSPDTPIGVQEPSTPVHGIGNAQQVTTPPSQHEATPSSGVSDLIDFTTPATERLALMGAQSETPANQRIVNPSGHHLMTPTMRHILTPTSVTSRPTNPTPGHPNNWAVFATPVTPVEAFMRRFAAGGRVGIVRNAPSSASSGSIRIFTANPDDDDDVDSPLDDALASSIFNSSSSPPFGVTPATLRDFVVNMPEATTSSLVVNTSSPTGSSDTVTIQQDEERGEEQPNHDSGNTMAISLNNFVEYDGTESEPGINPEQQQSRRLNYGTFPENARQRPASCWDAFSSAQINVILIALTFTLVAVGTLAWVLASVIHKH